MALIKQVCILTALVVGLAVGVVADEKKPERAMCPVCAANGETEEEKIKAEFTYEGTTHYFCSKDCRDAFEGNPAAYLPAALPRVAGAFTVESRDGQDVTLAQFKGNVVLVDFWATWCKPCVKSMPQLQALHDKYRERGLRLLGVSIDEGDDSAKKVEKFLKDRNLTYTILLDAKDKPAWHTYNVQVVPSMFLIDRAGMIVAEWKGDANFEEVDAAIQLALSSE